jgi:O-antigen/teichoic acid export membrane protein
VRTDLFRNSLIYTSGNVLARGLSFIIQVTVWSNLFPPEVYGQIAYCYVFISFMSVLLPFGTDAAFMNYYVRKEQKAAYLSNTLMFIMLMALAFVALSFLFRHTLTPLALRSDSVLLLNLSLIILFFDILNNQGILYLRAENRAAMSVLLLNIEIIVRFILLILLISVLSNRIEYILWANVVSSMVLSLILLVIMMPQLRFSLLSRKILKQLFVFGIPFMIAGLFDRTIELADRRLLGYFKGDETVGLYVACYTIAVLIRLVVYSFNAGWQPFFLREIDREEGRARLERIHIQTGSVFIILWFLGSIWLPDIVRIPIGEGRHILNAAYWEGLPVIPVIMGAYVMMGLYLLQLPGIYYRNKTGMNALFMGAGALVNILMNLLLIPKMGMMGAAIATASAYALMAFAIRVWNGQFSAVRKGSVKIILMIAVSAGMYLLSLAAGLSMTGKILVTVVYLTGMYLIQPLRLSSIIRKK